MPGKGQAQAVTTGKTMRIGAILEGVGTDHRTWLDPSVPGDASIDVNWYIENTRLAEAAMMDFIFLVDSPFVTPDLAPHFLNRLEPLTLLSALASVTTRIGLIATASTTYRQPYNLAREFASLDHISHGRAGWNIVTTAVSVASKNFGSDEAMLHADRYRMASEFVEVVRGLWDSYEDDAFPRDRATGQFLDPAKMHPVDFEGEFYSVAGPMSMTRSPQGHPVLVQAGDSPAGRDFAARYADAVLVNVDFDQTLAYRRDMHDRIRSCGRDPSQVVFFSGLIATLGETGEEARAIAGESLDFKRLLWGLSRIFEGYDFTGHDLDGPFPDLSGITVNTFRGQADRILEAARNDRLTLREMAISFDMWASDFVGTPEIIADEMVRWVDEGACDGFMFRVNKPRQFALFRERVIPILQERGRFRKDYEATTLRGNLGLAKPAHRHGGNAS